MNQRQIAQLAGVSTATVSRVINKDKRVSDATRRKVQRVIDKNFYVQNLNARNLRASNTNTIGFLVSNFANPFFIAVYSGLEPICRKQGYNIIIGNTNEDVEQERKAIDLFLQYRVDGIVASFVQPDETVLNKLRSFNAEVLMLDRLLDNFRSDYILIDNVNGAIEQVKYIAGLGHKKIAVIKGTDFESNGKFRMQGFIRGMEECGLPVRDEYIVSGDFLEEAAYSAAVKLMHLPDPPTAIIAHNNLMCIGAYKALKDMRLSVPEDVSLIGFDDFELSEHLQPSITLIDRPIREMGEMAGKMLIERIEKQYTGEPREVIFPVKMRIGGSCGAPRRTAR